MFYLLDMCTVYHCKVTLKHLWPRVYSVFSETLPYKMLFYTHKREAQIYGYFEKSCRKNVHATIPKGNMGYHQYTVPDNCSCRIYLWCFPLALANICPWPQVPFFQISLKKSELKTTHNTFWDCRVHFFRQPFSKKLYMTSASCL